MSRDTSIEALNSSGWSTVLAADSPWRSFHRNPFRGFGAQGVKIWHFPLLWLVAFTTACTTVQAVIHLQQEKFT